MATFQSLGVGSGMDLGSLVTQLVAAERAPKQTQITTQQSQVAVQISAMGTPRSRLKRKQSSYSGAAAVPRPFQPRSLSRTSPQRVATTSKRRGARVREIGVARTPRVVLSTKSRGLPKKFLFLGK